MVEQNGRNPEKNQRRPRNPYGVTETQTRDQSGRKLVSNRLRQEAAFTFNHDHPCGLGVTSLLLTQWARVQSPVGSTSWLRFFQGFPSTVRQLSVNLGHIRSRLSYGRYISFKPYIIRLRTATVSDFSCSTALTIDFGR